MNYWVYILSCANGAYYTGYTDNLIRRYHAHRLGKASKFTRSFKPLYLAQCWQIDGPKGQALKLECFIKKLPKSTKNYIISHPEQLNILYEDWLCKVKKISP